MRVISGSRRGTVLFSPDTEKTRPTTDRVKENIYNLIQFNIAGSVVLDLFSGSGAMGIEALSRGAAECVFVDSDKNAINIIKKNIDKTGFNDKSQIFRMPFDEYLLKSDKKFDLIFLDPPYHKGLTDEALKLIVRYNLFSDKVLFVLESDYDESVVLPPVFEAVKEKLYGRVKVVLAERKELI